MSPKRRSRTANHFSADVGPYTAPRTRSKPICDNDTRDTAVLQSTKPPGRKSRLQQQAKIAESEEDIEPEERGKVAIDHGTFYSSICWDKFATGSGIDPYAAETTDHVATQHGDHRISSDIQFVRDSTSNNGVAWMAKFGSNRNNRRPQQPNPIVARFSKLSLVDTHVRGLTDSEDHLSHIHSELARAISVLGPSDKVNVKSVFDNQVRTYTVKTAKDLIVVTLRIFWILSSTLGSPGVGSNQMRWKPGCELRLI